MSRYSLFPQRPTAAQLITHVHALLCIAHPDHLREKDVHEALMQVAEVLGRNLSEDEVRRVVRGADANPPPPRKGGAS